MKNTKKLLILLSAITVLVATLFSMTVVAAPLVSGEGTSIDEYTSKKVTQFYHFETGTQSIRSVRGDPSRAGTNNARPTVNYVYSPDELSLYYLKLNYYENETKNPNNLHGYVEPTVGTLDDVEKTPVNGYVAEFDIAFFSPFEVVNALVTVVDGNNKTKEVRTTVKEPLYVFKVENGNYVFDENGNYVYETELDKNGEVLMQDVYPQKTELKDGEEVPVYEAILDEKGSVIGARPVYDTTKTPTRQPVYKKQLDADGKEILVDKVIKGAFEGLDTKTFDIQMQNDPLTQLKGAVNLLYFNTVATQRTVNVKIAGNNNVVHSFPADQWCHFTIQYDAKTALTYIYIGRDDSTYVDSGVTVTGRKLIGTLETQGINQDAGNVSVPIYPLTFRLGSSAVKGEVAIDNLVGYQGTTVHNPTFVTDKTVVDKFIYIAETLEKCEIATDSYQAYNFLKSDADMQGVLKGTSYGVDANGNKVVLTAAQKETVERLKSVYREYSNDETNTASLGIYDDLIEAVKAENVLEYLEYVKVAEDTPRLITNTEIRAQRVALAEDFVAKAGNLIDMTSKDFENGRRKIASIKATLAGDAAANEFVSWMTTFENSVAFGASLSRLQSHYNHAAELYSSITNYEEFNGIKTSEESYEALKAAVEAYNSAAENMKAKTNNVNSERFVFIIELMKEKTTGSWENDGAEVENLWYRAFQIIVSEQFEENYEGFEEAKRVYDLAHNCFWNKLQKENIAVLTEKLDSFNDPDNSYVDRAGICTYVDRYLEFNAIDIDFTNEEIINIQARNEAYKAQLGTLQGDYKNLLVENTTLFINVMKMIENFSTYKDLKPLFDEATSYYYTMNIEGEGIEERVEQYRVLAEKMEAIEFDSGMFVAIVNGDLGYTALGSISDKDELYRSLTDCYSCIDNLDLTYEGVESAKAVYDEKYSEYTNEINVINSHIDEASNVAFATRGNWDIDGIVAFVKKLIDMIKE